jgi:hypothetical protein
MLAMGGAAADFANTTISENVAGAFITYQQNFGDLHFSGNTTVSHDAAGFLNAVYTPETPVIASLDVSADNGSGQTSATFQSKRAARIAAIRTQLSSADNEGEVTLQVALNGGPWVTVQALVARTRADSVVSTRGNPIFTVSPRDALEFRLITKASQRVRGQIQLLGMYD